MSARNPVVRVEPLTPQFAAAAHQWAQRLDLPEIQDAAEFALQIGADGLQLQLLEAQAPGPVRVDFVEGAATAGAALALGIERPRLGKRIGHQRDDAVELDVRILVDCDFQRTDDGCDRRGDRRRIIVMPFETDVRRPPHQRHSRR